MKSVPYWIDTAPAFPDRSTSPLPESVDVAIVGGGITGLSSAVHLARKGGRVALLEQSTLGSGASMRNGGMSTTGLFIGPATARDRYGLERARRYYDAYRSAVDFVQSFVATEGIACDFRRAGRLGVAVRPQHFEHQRATHELLAKEFGHETRLIEPRELRSEIGSDAFHGALLDPLSAGLHVGKFVYGLAASAEQSGALLCEGTRVTNVERAPDRTFLVRTSRGVIRARQVLVATDGYTDAAFPRLRRRITTVGSFLIVTEPLSEERARDIIPNARMVVDTKNIGHYFRLSPDNRLIFGGRARFALSNPASDLKSGAILEQDMLDIFPQLRGVRLDYLWGGTVGFTFDRNPHAGEMDGLYYSLGYCGHGVQMATYMGRAMSEVMDGHPEANPWRDLDFPAFPVYSGKAWFLPFVGAYYRLKDRLA